MVVKNQLGESIPVLQPKTARSVIVDGTSAHAESSPLEPGVYRLAVESSVDDLGVHIVVVYTGGVMATSTSGLFMSNGAIEYFAIDSGEIISVIDGKLNITPFV